MKLNKKHYIILAIVIVLIAIWYFFLRKKKAESSYTKTSVTPCSCPGCKHLPKGHPLCKTCCVIAKEESGMASGTIKCPRGTHPCKSGWVWWAEKCCNDAKKD